MGSARKLQIPGRQFAIYRVVYSEAARGGPERKEPTMKNLIRIALIVSVATTLVVGACKLGNAINTITEARDASGVQGTVGVLTVAEVN